MRKVIGALGGLALLTVSLFTLANATGPTIVNSCLYSWSEPVTQGLASFNVYMGTVSGGPYTKIGSVVAVNSTGGTSYNPTTNFCAGQTAGQKYATVTAVGTDGSESAFATEVPFVLSLRAAVPTNLSVTQGP